MITVQTKLYRQNKTEPILLFRITNNTGAYVELTNLGAAWISAVMPDKEGFFSDVLLGYEDLQGYIDDTYYMGSTIGRFANRISNASFVINGKTYHLEKNDGKNTNHGGFSGLHKKIWKWEEITSGVRFFIDSPDSEGGYPGNLQLSVDYVFDEDNSLTIHYRGITDTLTYLNLTNHAYFNLSAKHDTVLNHLLYIPATEIIETTADFIPTGKFAKVRNTPFDFTSLRSVGERFYEDNQQLRWNKGYNHCYVLKKNCSNEMKLAGSLVEPLSGRSLEVETTLPGVLLYTAGYLNSDKLEKNGKPISPDTGICFETQFFPDTPSHKNFPSCILNAGEVYDHVTKYNFRIHVRSDL